MTINPIQKKIFAFILLIACFNLFMGCNRYYKPVKINAPTVETKGNSLRKLNEENKYFIVRNGMQYYALSNLILDESNMTIKADITKVPPEHQLYIRNANTKYTYSKGKKQGVVLTEVHLYTKDSISVDTTNQYTLSLADIEKIEVLNFDNQRTSKSFTWGIIGVTLGVGLVILAIAALSYTPPPAPDIPEGSCPYISAYNGENFSLQGEIYSAAIYPSLQKEDYLPLQMKPFNGDWCIKISNELKEIQHTDFANLLVAEHPDDVRLLIDPQGKMHSISEPQLPLTALLNNQRDVSNELKFNDYKSCLFNEGNGKKNREDLYLNFKNDGKHTTGKLIVSARSSSWFLYVYDEFTKGFGNYYNRWVKKQEKTPVNELEKWTNEQHIPLTISVKTANGWNEINKVETIGPLLNREVVIPLNLSANEQVEVKISCGYMFWELDYVGMDYSENAFLSVNEIQPYEAINEKGMNVLGELASADKKFLIQPNTGDSTIIKYKMVPAKAGMSQTFFLHTSGYYHHPRNPKGTPKVAFLKSFEKPGAMSAFSKQKFFEAWNNLATSKN